ncbi:UNVERIFIED_CONTAM: hypothetical protein K2H54_061631, partial [Gekko kuhli]
MGLKEVLWAQRRKFKMSTVLDQTAYKNLSKAIDRGGKEAVSRPDWEVETCACLECRTTSGWPCLSIATSEDSARNE